MNIIAFAIRYPVTTSVGVILVVLFGLVSLITLPVQLTPDVSKPEITVQTRWPGGSPKEVEREIIDKQEEQLKGVEGLEKMFGDSSYNAATITMRFPAGTSIDTSLLHVSNRLNQVKDYPDDATEPIISSANTQGVAMAWFTLESTGDNPVSVDTMRDFAEDVIQARFERVRGVAASNVYGGRNHELRVVVDPMKLAMRSLTIQELAQALDEENRDFSAGDFDEGKRAYIVRTVGEYRSPDDVARVIIARRDGRPVYVRDVAKVSIEYADPMHVVRDMGHPSIAINVVRKNGANVLDTMEALKVVTKELNDTVLARKGFMLFQAYDETNYVYSSIGLVQKNLLVGSLLAITVLLLFLRAGGATLMLGLAIPISIMGTFIALWVLDRNVNIVSLAGMTFAAGMLVDNSIVVLENIYRHREAGASLFHAARDGAAEVWGAVLASTLTTIAVFVPIVFVQEQAGQLFRDIAIAISAGVGLSLIVSITVIPCLSVRILRTRTRTAETTGVVTAGAAETAGVVTAGAATADISQPPRRTEGITARIGAFVYWMCGSVFWRVSIICGLTTLAVGTAWLLLPQAEYLPSGNRNLVFGVVLPPPGYNTDTLVRLGQSIERTLEPYWEAEPNSPDEAALDGPGIRNFFYVARGHSVFMGARTHDNDQARGLLPVLRKAMTDIPGIIGIVAQSSLFQGGLNSSRNINIEITGPDLDRLVELGGRVFGRVKEVLPGAQARPKPSLDLGSPEIRVRLKRDRAADVQMTNKELGYIIDTMVDGAKASNYQFEGREIDLTIRGEDRYADRTQDLTSIPVFTRGGRLATVGDVADVVLVAGPEQISHIERERAITIQVIPPADLPLETAMETLEAQLLRPLRDSGDLGRLYNLRLSGTADDLTKTYDALKYNFLLALLITYLLMAALFESFLYPFVIIFSVPLAAAGGVLGLFVVNLTVARQPLDVLSMLGFIILIGVVVNNAILVVHQALNFMAPSRRDPSSPDTRTGAGMSARRAISESVRSRIRPIMMSTLTTTFGLLPLVLASGAGSELYRGIGSVVLGGLALSSVFTLLVVPALFSLVMDVTGRDAALDVSDAASAAEGLRP